MRRLAAALAAAALAAPAWASEPADYLLNNALVFQGSSTAAVQAVALRGGRIAAVGPEARLAVLRDSHTVVADLGGSWVLPGFDDAHVHVMDGGLTFFRADLSTAASPQAAAAIVGEFAKAHPGEPWVLGQGWSHTLFPGERYPTRQDLDAAVADRPVLLEHVDGHLVWANSKALEAAGVGKETPDPKNGQLIRDPDSGEPTGVFLEGAMELVARAVPKPDGARRMEALSKAVRHANALGVTSLQGLLAADAAAELEAWRALAGSGTVTLRYSMWGRLEDPEGFLRLKESFSDLPRDRFQFLGVKGFVDGVLSARTAVLHEPYADAPDAVGVPNFTQSELNRMVLKANRLGLQVALHAIGDGAVRMALDAFETARRETGPLSVRNRIEHVEVFDPRDLERFRRLDVVASMQPSHMLYDSQSQNYNDARLGPKRVRHAFAWRSLEQAGAALAFGTDWPVMPLDPRVGLYAAVTRQHFDGSPLGGWVPEQRLRLEDAVRHYTAGSAYAESREREKGAVAPGMRADLVVLGAELFEATGGEIRRVPVLAVIFDGRPVYADPAAPFAAALGPS